MPETELAVTESINDGGCGWDSGLFPTFDGVVLDLELTVKNLDAFLLTEA